MGWANCQVERILAINMDDSERLRTDPVGRKFRPRVWPSERKTVQMNNAPDQWTLNASPSFVLGWGNATISRMASAAWFSACNLHDDLVIQTPSGSRVPTLASEAVEMTEKNDRTVRDGEGFGKLMENRWNLWKSMEHLKSIYSYLGV